jgi:hypothetical protein
MDAAWTTTSAKFLRCTTLAEGQAAGNSAQLGQVTTPDDYCTMYMLDNKQEDDVQAYLALTNPDFRNKILADFDINFCDKSEGTFLWQTRHF